MNREIKFRGKRIDNGELVYGWFTKEKKGSLIVPVIQIYKEWDTGDYIESYEIDGDSLSEFTGLKDKNGIEIYENDTIKIPDLDFIDFIDNGTSSPDEKYEDGIVEIFFDEGGFCFNHPNTDTPCPIYYDIKNTELVAAQ